MQPQWLPPAELRSRLPRLADLTDLRTVDAAIPPEPGALPQELAHDRWLRQQLAPDNGAAGIAPGAMTAIRLLAPLNDSLSGWLLEPAHFHLAKDHLVMVAGATRGLEREQAQRLIESIGSLLAEESLSVTLLSPSLWLLGPPAPPPAQSPGTSTPPLQLTCASPEAASGRNVEGYLPHGADARRYRKLLNEIQMAWHEHPVNQAREARGELPINSVWLSGPVTQPALAAWNEALAQGRYELDDSLLVPRLRDDQASWLEALQVMDARLHELLTSAAVAPVLLCGDHRAHWLQRKPGGTSAWPGAIGNSLAGLARGFRSLVPGRSNTTHGRRRHQGNDPITDVLVQMFTEK